MDSSGTGVKKEIKDETFFVKKNISIKIETKSNLEIEVKKEIKDELDLQIGLCITDKLDLPVKKRCSR